MLALEVNRVELGAGPRGPAPESTRGVAVVGRLWRSRSGWLRGLQWITGVALLRGVALGVAFLLGYRHQATLSCHPGSLELRGERRFMGLSLGSARQIIPRGAVRQVRLVAASGAWSLCAGLAALAVSAGLGTLLVLWGVLGRHPSWVELGGAVLAAGVLLDALAYLWIRRRAASGRATLEIRTAAFRFLLSGVSQRGADALLDELRDASAP